MIEPLFNEYLAVGATAVGRLHNDVESVRDEASILACYGLERQMALTGYFSSFPMHRSREAGALTAIAHQSRAIPYVTSFSPQILSPLSHR